MRPFTAGLPTDASTASAKSDGVSGETVTVGIHPSDVMSYDVPAEA